MGTAALSTTIRTVRRRRFVGMFRSISGDQRGLSTVEYIIILALIAVSGIGLWNTFGKNVRDKISESNAKMNEVKISDQTE